MKRFLRWACLLAVVGAPSVALAAKAPGNLDIAALAAAAKPESPPTPEWAKLWDGVAAFGADRYQEAIRIATELVSTASDPDVLIEAEHLLVQATRWDSGYQAAIAEAEKLRPSVQKAGPQSSRELSALDEMMADLRDAQAFYERVVGEYRRIIAERPGTKEAAEAAYQIGNAHQVAGRLGEAVRAYREVVRGYPATTHDFESRIAVARISERSGEAHSARGVLKRAAIAFARSELAERAVRRLERLYAREGAYAQGARAMRELARARPGTPMASAAALASGRLLESNGEVLAALERYREAIGEDAAAPSAVEAVLAVKNMHLSRERPEEAIRQLAGIVASYPGTEAAARAQYCIGEVHKALGRSHLAEEAFFAVLRAYPLSNTAVDAKSALAHLRYDKARAYLRKGRRASAVGAFRAGLSLDPDEVSRCGGVAMLAATLVPLGRFDEAHACLRPLITSTSPALAWWRESAQYLDAQCYYMAGDDESALAGLTNIASTCRTQAIKDAAEALMKQILTQPTHPTFGSK